MGRIAAFIFNAKELQENAKAQREGGRLNTNFEFSLPPSLCAFAFSCSSFALKINAALSCLSCFYLWAFLMLIFLLTKKIK